MTRPSTTRPTETELRPADGEALILSMYGRTGLNPTQRSIVLAVGAAGKITVDLLSEVVDVTPATLRSKKTPGYLPALVESGDVRLWDGANAAGDPRLWVYPGPRLRQMEADVRRRRSAKVASTPRSEDAAQAVAATEGAAARRAAGMAEADREVEASVR